MAIILVTQEIGSRDDEVTAGAPARLGLELMPQEQAEQRVAERKHTSKFTARHFLQGTASLVERWAIGRHRLVRQMTVEATSIAARGGAVVQGWGATALLRPVRRIIRLHICAPAGNNTSVPGTALCCRSQPGHGVLPLLSADRCDSHGQYDLVLATGRVSVDECVEQVYELAQDSPSRLPSQMCEAGSRAAAVLEVDVAGVTIRLPAGTSREEAIARVERHLRGRKTDGGSVALGSWPVSQQGIL